MIADAFRQAHDLVAARGLARQRYYDDATGALDVEGALHFVLPYRKDRELARTILRESVNHLDPSKRPRRDNFDLGYWSDQAGKPKVLAVLLDAAQRAERLP